MRDWSFPVGVHELHEDTSLDFQLNRLATLGGGWLEEIREVAPRIRDLADWKREFLALADRAISEDRSRNGAAYLRAAEFFMASGRPRCPTSRVIFQLGVCRCRKACSQRGPWSSTGASIPTRRSSTRWSAASRRPDTKLFSSRVRGRGP